MTGVDPTGIQGVPEFPQASPGRSIPDAQVPWPDWWTSVVDSGDYQVTIRLRGRDAGNTQSHTFDTLGAAQQVATLFQGLGWGGDATLTDLSGPTIIATYYAPLTDPNAPI